MPQMLCNFCSSPTDTNGTCVRCGRASKQSAPDNDILPPDTRLAGGRVILGGKLGRGGFGVTYAGLDTKTNQPVAVKEFFPRHLAKRQGKRLMVDPDKQELYDQVLRSFHKEAKTIHLLDSHPSIVRVLTLFDENDTAYYTMEMLRGMDLHKYLKALGRPLTPAEAFQLLAPVMDALCFVHKSKVLHRDISPDNILLCMDTAKVNSTNPSDIQKVKLIDFGAAHVAVEEFTQSYPEVRKNGYSPLEQNWSGDFQGPWTDVYALAATFYLALTGKTPIPARERAQDHDTLSKPSQLIEGTPHAVDNVILKGMALKPKERYQDIAEFRNAMHYSIYGKSYREPAEEDKPAKGGELAGRRLAALLTDSFLFTGLPYILGGVEAAFIGCLLMMIINAGLICLKPGGSLGERLLHLKLSVSSQESLSFARSAARSILRSLTPAAVMSEVICLISGDIPFYDRWTHVSVDFAGAVSGTGMTLPGMDGTKANDTQRHTDDAVESAPEKSEMSALSQETDASPMMRTSAAPTHGSAQITLICTAGSMAGRRITQAAPLMLGRDARRANILIPREDREVSGLHASIRQSDTKFMLSDENSINGTRINGNRLDPNGAPVILRDGDIIELGKVVFTINIR